ncbi:MAG: DUF4159 domain-containing protein [Acidobacteriota bacterium]
MIRRLSRIGLIGLLMALAGASALAQRGGGYFRGSVQSNVRYDGKFVFVRMSFPDGRGWWHDYPVGEQHFMNILTNVSNISAHVDETSILAFNDPELFKFPLAYLVEPGYWTMTDDQAKGLREYLLKGGFMIVDDFPSWAWGNFDLQMSRLFPEGRWVDLDITHPIFHSFFEIPSLDLPPPYPQLGSQCLYRALFVDNDPNKRMMVIANYQNDISEYWEWSASGRYAVDESNEAYKFGVNEFIYGITH